jgi:carbon-monoxide dehydrogenase medium subunit
MVARFADGVRVGVTGARDHAFRLEDFEQALASEFSAAALDGKEVAEAGMNADIHASAEYRAAMVSVMARRAVVAAGGKA